ncbi:hypothetical protein [Corynebacterium variabile]|uniref:hypothetical protein n=1 Tax=Corynebacterium variabile TaxID=1727 RepID=UPI0037350882
MLADEVGDTIPDQTVVSVLLFGRLAQCVDLVHDKSGIEVVDIVYPLFESEISEGGETLALVGQVDDTVPGTQCKKSGMQPDSNHYPTRICVMTVLPEVGIFIEQRSGGDGPLGVGVAVSSHRTLDVPGDRDICGSQRICQCRDQWRNSTMDGPDCQYTLCLSGTVRSV